MIKPKTDLYKLPRLYLDAVFASGSSLELEVAPNHYLRNVLRKQEGDLLRVFNGRDGEWLARISQLGKKKGEVVLEKCLREQPDKGADRSVHLYFSPIKKQRMDMLVEKAVELGVTKLHPVIMRRTVSRKLNEDRIRAQIIEAAEQCERLDIPVLEPVNSLDEVLAGLNDLVYACIERNGSVKPLSECDVGDSVAFLIGPEGGFEEGEIERLCLCEKVVSVSLGDSILRAETAAMACLSWCSLT